MKKGNYRPNRDEFIEQYGIVIFYSEEEGHWISEAPEDRWRKFFFFTIKNNYSILFEIFYVE